MASQKYVWEDLGVLMRKQFSSIQKWEIIYCPKAGMPGRAIKCFLTKKKRLTTQNLEVKEMEVMFRKEFTGLIN